MRVQLQLERNLLLCLPWENQVSLKNDNWNDGTSRNAADHSIFITGKGDGNFFNHSNDY